MLVNMDSITDANTLRVVSGVVRRCTPFSGFFSLFVRMFCPAAFPRLKGWSIFPFSFFFVSHRSLLLYKVYFRGTKSLFISLINKIVFAFPRPRICLPFLHVLFADALVKLSFHFIFPYFFPNSSKKWFRLVDHLIGVMCRYSMT
jgi:hypothetical protein